MPGASTKISLAWVGTLALLAGACVSKQSHELINAFDDKGSKQYQAAWIEYIGPDQKWAGGSLLKIEIDLKKSGKDGESPLSVQYGNDPVQFKLQNRGANRKVAAIHMASHDALQELALVLQDSKKENRNSCIHPVRVQLKRIDGAIEDHFGCRGVDSWVFDVSRLTDQLIRQSVE